MRVERERGAASPPAKRSRNGNRHTKNGRTHGNGKGLVRGDSLNGATDSSYDWQAPGASCQAVGWKPAPAPPVETAAVGRRNRGAHFLTPSNSGSENDPRHDRSGTRHGCRIPRVPGRIGRRESRLRSSNSRGGSMVELAPDFGQFFGSLIGHSVEFLIVGAYALAYHGALRIARHTVHRAHGVHSQPAGRRTLQGSRRYRGARGVIAPAALQELRFCSSSSSRSKTGRRWLWPSASSRSPQRFNRPSADRALEEPLA